MSVFYYVLFLNFAALMLVALAVSERSVPMTIVDVVSALVFLGLIFIEYDISKIHLLLLYNSVIIIIYIVNIFLLLEEDLSDGLFAWFTFVMLVLTILCEINLIGRCTYLASAPGQKVIQTVKHEKMGRRTARDIVKKIGQLGSLEGRLSEEEKKFTNVRSEFIKEIKKHKEEVREDVANSDIQEYDEAIKDLRIRDNLALISKKLAYADELAKAIDQVQKASEETRYRREQAQADLKILSVLSGDQINSLIENIDRALSSYSGYENLVISMDGVTVKDTEQVWNDIFPDTESESE